MVSKLVPNRFPTDMRYRSSIVMYDIWCTLNDVCDGLGGGVGNRFKAGLAAITAHVIFRDVRGEVEDVIDAGLAGNANGA